MTTPEVSVSDLRWSYGENEVLRGCTFDVAAGEFVCLAGPNGAGKSTLLMLLTGCAAPQTGAVRLAGEKLGAMSERNRARRIAVVPQTESTPPSFTALQTVLLGRTPWLEGFLRFDSAEDRAIARDALETVGMSDFAERPIGKLSGGERRLVTIARALAQRPALLMLDEPAASLDLMHQQSIFRLLRRLNQEESLTIIAVTHDLNLASLYSDRVLLLNNGEVVGDGPPAELLEETFLQEVYGAELWTHQHEGRRYVGLKP